MDFLYGIINTFQVIMIALIIYYFVLSFFGLYRKKEIKNYGGKNSFALVVAAHNEEIVISRLIDSLNNQNYPKEKFDIFVVADNCTDNTAKIAREKGVYVYERFNKVNKGKGFALEWLFKKVFALEKNYDVIGIFDADNLVSPDWCKEMDSKLEEGYKVVQGYIDTKNPNDTWISFSYAFAYWSQNRMYQLAKKNLGLSNQLGGTGFAVKTEVIKEYGFGATCLAEDLELTCKLILNNEKVGWCHDAIIYDEKPLTIKQSWIQRRRWMQGFSDVASRYFFKLLKKGLLERKFYIIDCAIYVIQPYFTVMIGISSLIALLASVFSFNKIISLNDILNNVSGSIAIMFIVLQLCIIPISVKLDKKIGLSFFFGILLYSSSMVLTPFITKILLHAGISVNSIIINLILLIISIMISGISNLKLFIYYIFYAVFNFTWIPISVEGIIKRKNKEWNPTKHIRNVELYDIK